MSIPPRGFTNINACCWWNSLLQALLSCEHFVSTLSEINDSNTKIYKTFKQFIEHQKNPVAGMIDNITLLKIFLHELREKQPKSFEIMVNGQQSASEGFSLLLDLLGSPSINALFMHSYEQSIIETLTQKEVSSSKRTNNNFFTQFNEEDLLERGLKACLLLTMEKLNDYKIDDKRPAPCLKILKLKRISPIVVILLNRYKRIRTDVALPETVVINNKNGGSMVFYKKSIVDHSGSLFGGHYVARGVRKVGPDEMDIILFNDDSLYKNCNLATTKNSYITMYESISRDI